jgi:putative N-acetylmannosamine-6-phosphate epimerase
MADCATLADGQRALDMGFDLLGSTMSGYTGGPEPDEPDLDLVRGLAGLGAFTVAEGRYRTPAQAAAAMAVGADAVVAGSAITRPEHVTAWFVAAITGGPP